MYAVIETGGKQYRVEVGTELEVETLDAEPGQSVTLERVLLVADGDDTSIGRPVVANAAVEAEVVRRDRGDKLIVFKYRPKARRRVKKGHRQNQTILRVTDVRLGDRSAAEEVRERERAAQSERDRLEEAARRQAAADAALAQQLAAKSKTEGEAEPSGRGRARASKADSTADNASASRKGASGAKADAKGTSAAKGSSGAKGASGAKASGSDSKGAAGGAKGKPASKSDSARPKSDRRKDS